MSFSTGTVTNLNDLLNTFATFLASVGWTIDGNWREPIYTHTLTGGLEPVYHWRWGRRLHVHKGTKYISMQDFYLSKNLPYGSIITLSGSPPANVITGPGIAAAISTSFLAQPSEPVDLNDYDAVGPVTSPEFATQPGVPGSVSGIVRTVVMPLPAVVSQDTGTWKNSEFNMVETTPGLPAPFGDRGGSAIPCKYWFMADATGDNVIMVVLRDRGDLSYIPITPYLYFGTIEKEGTWTGGNYLGACHGNNNPFTSNLLGWEGFQANRWGPPGSMMDGTSVHTLLRIDIDSFTGAGKYAGLQLNENNDCWTGRHFSSTSAMVPKAGDPAGGIFGVEQNGIWLGTARTRRSILWNGAPMWPTYWVAKRDITNGVTPMFSVIGRLPNICQTNTQGFAPGNTVIDNSGEEWVVFDGFAVRKVP